MNTIVSSLRYDEPNKALEELVDTQSFAKRHRCTGGR